MQLPLQSAIPEFLLLCDAVAEMHSSFYKHLPNYFIIVYAAGFHLVGHPPVRMSCDLINMMDRSLD